MPRNRKEYYEYISTDNKPVVTLQQYQEMPATAFLAAIVGAKKAAEMCIIKFKANRANYTQPAKQALQIVNSSLLAYIMGQYETYQKYLFAQMFEYSVYLTSFDVELFIKNLSKEANINIEIVRFAGYRDKPHSVGLVLAENLKNWQSPDKVNKYFAAFGLQNINHQQQQFLTNDDVNDLKVLWQMRHSIVHTANTITLPDSQKIDMLNDFGNKSIILEERFIPEIVRKFHPLIKGSTDRMESIYSPNIDNGVNQEIIDKIRDLFKVESSCNSWL